MKLKLTEYWAIKVGTRKAKCWSSAEGHTEEEAPWYWPNKSNNNPMRFKTREAANEYNQEKFEGRYEVECVRYHTLKGIDLSA